MQQHLAGEDDDLPIQRLRVRPEFESWLSSYTVHFGLQVDPLGKYIYIYIYMCSLH